MQWTNKLNLPQSIYKAVTSGEDRTPVEGVYHVTEFIKSVREIKLTRKHYNEISVDISDCINTLFGSAVHKILEMADPEHAEKKVEAVVNGIKLVGRIDKYDYDNKAIIDYKTIRRSHKDWNDYYMQGMLYAYMMLLNESIKTQKLKFVCLVKDAIKARDDKTVIVWEYDIKDSDYNFIADYIRDKAKLLLSDEMPMCSDAERWATQDQWKLFAKEDSVKATKILDHEPTPEEKGKYIVRHVCKNFTKCEMYCPVKKWCEELRK